MAKKKLSRDQKRKQKKQKRAQRQRPAAPLDPTGAMIQRLKKVGLDRYEVMRTPPGEEKMSDVLMEFIRPYRQAAPTTEAMNQLIITALVAWNTAVSPEAEQAERLQEFAKLLPEEVVEDFYPIAWEMIERKQRYFAEYDRLILDYQLVDRGDDYHISVVSFMPTGKKEEEE